VEPVATRVIDWAVASRPLQRQQESGDGYLVRVGRHGTLVAVVDGVGHGPEAAAATKIAIATLTRHRQKRLAPLVELCHEALRGSRGVVMSMAWFDAARGTMAWLGVGNVEGLLFRGKPGNPPRCSSLLLRGGLVGDHLPSVAATSLPLDGGETLIFATDGIRAGLADEVDLAQSPRALADTILARSAKPNDDALVVVARYMGGTR